MKKRVIISFSLNSPTGPYFSLEVSGINSLFFSYLPLVTSNIKMYCDFTALRRLGMKLKIFTRNIQDDVYLERKMLTCSLIIAITTGIITIILVILRTNNEIEFIILDEGTKASRYSQPTNKYKNNT